LELTTNLERPSAGTEPVTTVRWLAASFRTPAASNLQLDSVTLLLANTSPGTPALEVFSDGSLEPGSLIGALAPPAAVGDSPERATFTADGIALDPDATYWVVLRAEHGAFEWAWTADSSGDGAGFDPTWDASEDGGQAWFTQDLYPLQLGVEVSDGAGEPSFIRGDCNDDGGVDISDAVCVLNWLFLGGSAPDCAAVANSNGDAAGRHLRRDVPPQSPFPRWADPHRTLSVVRRRNAAGRCDDVREPACALLPLSDPIFQGTTRRRSRVKERRKTRRAPCSRRESAWNATRVSFASPPCDSIAWSSDEACPS
jgi:hypothetical protein